MNNAAPSSADEGNWPKASTAWYMVVVLMLAYILSFIDRVVLGLLVGPIRADLGISETQMSLLYGFVFAIFYTGVGGKWRDRNSVFPGCQSIENDYPFP